MEDSDIVRAKVYFKRQKKIYGLYPTPLASWSGIAARFFIRALGFYYYKPHFLGALACVTGYELVLTYAA